MANTQNKKTTEEHKKAANKLEQDQVGNMSLNMEPPVIHLHTALMNNGTHGALQPGISGARDLHDHNRNRMVAPRIGGTTDNHGATITLRAASTFRETISMDEQTTQGADSTRRYTSILGWPRT